MKNEKLKLNIIPPQIPSTPEEDNKRLVQFFELLHEWHQKEKEEENKKR